MRGRVLAVALLCGSLAEAFLSTPTKAVRAKSCLRSLTVKKPDVVMYGGAGDQGGGGGRPPSDGRGDEDSGSDGGEEKKRVAIVDVVAATKKIYEKSGFRMPSGDLIAILGLILTTFLWSLNKIDSTSATINANINGTNAKIDNLDQGFQVFVICTSAFFGYLIAHISYADKPARAQPLKE
mmetsp:Transcript_20240/g.62577  ORF Transcript_20240/g.62577 Transcript_20240/m.62577 type:complete len:181 (-) Transcript_20240:646-1188(-)